MHELFVYYRVHAGLEADALAIVEAFQAGLREQLPELVARLLRRSAQPGARQTWMETYAMSTGTAGEGIDSDCQRRIEVASAALAHCIDGERHIEVFVSVAPD